MQSENKLYGLRARKILFIYSEYFFRIYHILGSMLTSWVYNSDYRNNFFSHGTWSYFWCILRDGNTRPPDFPLEKPVCRSGSNT